MARSQPRASPIKDIGKNAPGAHPRPIVVTSACLGFDACRYNGNIISAPFVQQLVTHIEFLKVCPEVEIGLGTPRDPIRLVASNEGQRLVQPATGQDLTQKMVSFSKAYLDTLEAVDGFILKNRSPSCAVKDSKIHSGLNGADVVGKGLGLFARAALERFPHAAVEDEGRLTNARLREHFLTRLFAQARYRMLRQAPSIRGLMQFQADNKLLLMAYNRKRLREMGQAVSGYEMKNLAPMLEEYGHHLGVALERLPRYTSNIHVLLHAFGYFSDRLSSRDKAFFLNALESYREKRTSLGAVLKVMKAWIVRFGPAHLARQTYFDPYPQALYQSAE